LTSSFGQVSLLVTLSFFLCPTDS